MNGRWYNSLCRNIPNWSAAAWLYCATGCSCARVPVDSGEIGTHSYWCPTPPCSQERLQQCFQVCCIMYYVSKSKQELITLFRIYLKPRCNNIGLDWLSATSNALFICETYCAIKYSWCSLYNTDGAPLSVCSVAFRTTPMDDTGVSHILEHTVLCGSAKYPCRDPFFKMLNRSLATFMNAFTCEWQYACWTHPPSIVMYLVLSFWRMFYYMVYSNVSQIFYFIFKLWILLWLCIAHE